MKRIEKINRRNTRNMIGNIIECYESASDIHLEEGINWYSEANALASDFAKHSDLDIVATSGIIAVLSPQCSWSRNAQAASDIMNRREVSVPVLGGSKRKALAIREGGNPDEFVRGQKVRSFWSIIADPEKSTAVAVDVHAFNLAIGRVTTDKERKILERVGYYDWFVSLYCAAAEMLRVKPHVCQAVTWVHHRSIYAYARRPATL